MGPASAVNALEKAFLSNETLQCGMKERERSEIAYLR